MTWAPFAMALAFGLLISATLHFILVWPASEPVDDDHGGHGGSSGPHGDPDAGPDSAGRGPGMA